MIGMLRPPMPLVLSLAEIFSGPADSSQDGGASSARKAWIYHFQNDFNVSLGLAGSNQVPSPLFQADTTGLTFVQGAKIDSLGFKARAPSSWQGHPPGAFDFTAWGGFSIAVWVYVPPMTYVGNDIWQVYAGAIGPAWFALRHEFSTGISTLNIIVGGFEPHLVTLPAGQVVPNAWHLVTVSYNLLTKKMNAWFDAGKVLADSATAANPTSASDVQAAAYGPDTANAPGLDELMGFAGVISDEQVLELLKSPGTLP